MDFIICLAHFCETHGPTSVLCTQIAPISCPTCHCCNTPPNSDDMRRSSVSASTRTRTPAGHSTSATTPYNSPPACLGNISASDLSSYFPKNLRNNTIKPENEHIRRPAVPEAVDDEYCQNCSFLVPRDVSSQIPEGAPGSPTKDGKSRHGSPILRTSQSVTAYDNPIHSSLSVHTPECAEAESTSSSSSSSSTSNSDLADLAHLSSSSSSLYTSPRTHTHRLTYISTRYPTSPAAYSNLRRSCIRTLSTENLPRGSGSGSLFFGDPIAGYSVTHVFRLPDPLARGRLRTYALIALGSRDNWKVSQVILEITRTFERLASRIVAMANRVLASEAAASAAAAMEGLSGLEGMRGLAALSVTSTSAPTRSLLRTETVASRAGKSSAPTTPTVKGEAFGGAGAAGAEREDGTDKNDGTRKEMDMAGDASTTITSPTTQLLNDRSSQNATPTPQSSRTTSKSPKSDNTTATLQSSVNDGKITPSSPHPHSQLQSHPQSQLHSQSQPQPQFTKSQQQPQSQPQLRRPFTRSITPLSSFLAAKKVDPDGYPRESHVDMLLQAKKGLAEIVGQEDFFVELHASFVVMLARLVGEFGIC